jgi:hypothetical protein
MVKKIVFYKKFVYDYKSVILKHNSNKIYKHKI